MNSGTLLASLIALATLAGAILHHKYRQTESLADQRVQALELELETLKAENNLRLMMISCSKLLNTVGSIISSKQV